MSLRFRESAHCFKDDNKDVAHICLLFCPHSVSFQKQIKCIKNIVCSTSASVVCEPTSSMTL